MAKPDTIRLDDPAVQDVVAGREISQSGLFMRLLVGALIGLIALQWMDWRMSLAYVAALCAWELLVAPLIIKSLSDRFTKITWLEFNLTSAAMVFVGAMIHAAAPALGWLSSNAAGQHFAVVYACGAVMMGVIYFNMGRLVMLAVITPSLLILGLGPLITLGLNFASALMSGAALIIVTAAIAASKDKVKMERRLTDHAGAQAAAESASALKTRLISVMSHELRTPLNAIIGYAELLRDEMAEGGAGQPEDAARIHGAGVKLLGLVNGYLEYSKLTDVAAPADLDDIAPGTLLADVAETLATEAASSKAKIELEPAPNRVLKSDDQRLRRALSLIAARACQVSPGGVVRIRARDKGDRLHLEIEDSGPGLRPDQAEALFDPFTAPTTLADRGSYGLNLAIAYKLVQSLGGAVSLAPGPGPGAAICVDLPWDGPAPHSPPQ
jgi:signal transduction histidine kinase